VATSGPAVAFALDSVSFFVSVACLVPLVDIPPPRQGESGPAHVLRDVREAWGTVRALPWLWRTILTYALTNVTLVGPYSVALPFLVTRHFHGQVGVLGLLYACFAGGYVVTDVWLGQRPHLRPRGPLIYGGLMGAGVFLAVLGLPVPIVAAALAAVLNSVALEVSALTWTTTLQEMIAPAQLGRVSSIDLLGSYVLTPVGYGVVGWATDRWGPADVIMLGGALTVVLAVVGLFHPSIRHLT